jgi:hypothetical protein
MRNELSDTSVLLSELTLAMNKCKSSCGNLSRSILARLAFLVVRQLIGAV